MRSDGGNVDHGATGALLLDLCGESVAPKVDALDVDSHDLVELSLGHVVGALVPESVQFAVEAGLTRLVGIRGAGVVHQNVDLAPELNCPVDGFLPVFAPRDIHLVEGKGFRCRGDLLAGFNADITHENLGTLLSEVLRDALTEASGSA